MALIAASRAEGGLVDYLGITSDTLIFDYLVIFIFDSCNNP